MYTLYPFPLLFILCTVILQLAQLSDVTSDLMFASAISFHSSYSQYQFYIIFFFVSRLFVCVFLLFICLVELYILDHFILKIERKEHIVDTHTHTHTAQYAYIETDYLITARQSTEKSRRSQLNILFRLSYLCRLPRQYDTHKRAQIFYLLHSHEKHSIQTQSSHFNQLSIQFRFFFIFIFVLFSLYIAPYHFSTQLFGFRSVFLCDSLFFFLCHFFFLFKFDNVFFYDYFILLFCCYCCFGLMTFQC